jgi:hypothetical protein
MDESSGSEVSSGQESPMLFRDYKNGIESKSKAAELKLGESVKRKAATEKIRRQRREAREEFLSRNKIALGVLSAAAGLVLSLGIVQSVINFVNGPERVVAQYATAIKTGDWDALQSNVLFPDSVGQVPELVKKAFDINAVSKIRAGEILQDGASAVATIFLDENDDSGLVIDLVSRPTQLAIFSVPKWHVASKAPMSAIVIGGNVQDSQKVKFGVSNPLTIEELRKEDFSSGSYSFSVLPGVYRTELSGIGFFDVNESSQVFWDADSKNQLEINPPENQTLPSSVINKARNQAAKLAKSCASSKCSEFPKYNEYDFNLWSQYTYGKYTFSTFSYKIKHRKCELQTSTVTSFDTANLIFTCDSSVKANLYVRYTYYYGYYSDYWYYWNLKDSKNESISPSVTLKTNDSGNGVSIVSSGF